MFNFISNYITCLRAEWAIARLTVAYENLQAEVRKYSMIDAQGLGSRRLLVSIEHGFHKAMEAMSRKDYQTALQEANISLQTLRNLNVLN